MASETWCGAAFAGFPCKKSLGHGGPHVYGDPPAAPTTEGPREAGTTCAKCGAVLPTRAMFRQHYDARHGSLADREADEAAREEGWQGPGGIRTAEVCAALDPDSAASRPGAPEGALLHANVAAIRDYFDAYCTGRPDCPVPHGAFAWMVGQLDRIATLEAAKERVAIRSTENAIAKHKAEAEVARLTEERSTLATYAAHASYCTIEDGPALCSCGLAAPSPPPPLAPPPPRRRPHDRHRRSPRRPRPLGGLHPRLVRPDGPLLVGHPHGRRLVRGSTGGSPRMSEAASFAVGIIVGILLALGLVVGLLLPRDE